MTSNTPGFLQDKAKSKAWSLRKTLGSPSETPSVCLLRNDPGCSRVLGTVTVNVFPGGRLPFQGPSGLPTFPGISLLRSNVQGLTGGWSGQVARSWGCPVWGHLPPSRGMG